MKRREFLTVPAAAIGGTLLYTLAGEPMRLQAQNGNGESAAAVLHRRGSARRHGRLRAHFPERRERPGRDRSRCRHLYRPPARRPLRPRQVSLHERAVRRIRIPSTATRAKRIRARPTAQGIKDLAAISPACHLHEQDDKLTSIEKTHFFQLLRTHTIEGMFCDPMHGGNAGLIGWQLVGYPGPQMSYRNEIDKHFGQPWRPKPASLEQITGRPGKPWEDEKD